jgi:hypothetical protein
MNGVANGLYGGDLPNQINTPWIDFSEQSTIVGWSSFTTKIIRYKVVGKMVFCYINIVGTSNSATTNFTLPFAASSTYGSVTSYNGGFVGIDNATGYHAYVTMTQSSNVISCGVWTTVSNSTATWTASGNKTIRGHFFYEIN